MVNMIINRARTTMDLSPRLLSLWKPIALSALICSLIVAVPPAQARAGDAEVWDMAFNGKDPRDSGFSGHTVNSSTFNMYDKLANGDVMPGWMTANGNPGGYFYRDPEKRNTRAGGWTAQWLMALANSGRGLALDFNDDTSLVTITYDAPANLVTLEDHLIALEGNTESVSVSVDLHPRAEHTFRLVRQPNSPTVELYIDNNPKAVASISPWPAADHGNAAKLNRVRFAHSNLNAAWDFFRYHSGATIPKPAKETSKKIRVKAKGGYQTYVIRPAINNSAIIEGQPLPAVCKDEKVMNIMCARGEYEPASFLIRADRPLKQVMVKVGRLKGQAGKLPGHAVDVRIAQKFYRSITWENLAIPWVLVHDPGMITIVNRHPKWVREMTEAQWKSPGGHSLAQYKAGRSRLNQLNKELVDTEELQPGDITDYRQFWLTVHIPDDARAGTYKARVTITAKNAKKTKLTLVVTVPDFDLLPPKFEYSIYYPSQILLDTMDQSFVDKYHPLTQEQYLADLRNMVAHGCMNPNIYGGVHNAPNGGINPAALEATLKVREKAGIGPGVPLYTQTSVAEPVSKILTEEEKSKRVQGIKKVIAWAKARGYPEILWMGCDEFSGEALRKERDSFQAIRDGGGKIFVACGSDFFDIIGDLLNVPVFAHPGAMAVDRLVQVQVDAVDWLLHPERTPNWDPEILMTPGYQKMIADVHKNGHKIFTYFDPQGGQPFPQYHRRHRGLGLWKTGLDGTMTWAYVHIGEKIPRPDDQQIKDNGLGISQNSFVIRGPAGVLDTLSWEGFREGYDDARYLATLQDAIARAKAASRHDGLVAQAERWLDDVRTCIDLDAWRRHMAVLTERLMK